MLFFGLWTMTITLTWGIVLRLNIIKIPSLNTDTKSYWDYWYMEGEDLEYILSAILKLEPLNDNWKYLLQIVFFLLVEKINTFFFKREEILFCLKTVSTFQSSVDILENCIYLKNNYTKVKTNENLYNSRFIKNLNSDNFLYE